MDTLFDKKGRKIPVTLVEAGPCFVVQIKTEETDGYNAVQIGFGKRKSKKTTKPILGHVKKAKLPYIPKFLREVRVKEKPNYKPGDLLTISDFFSPGDKVKITGVSKGRGFAGVMKRWGFAGGPATHGQSDRARAPGSIGAQGVGRVWPGKKMAGRFGGKKVTIRGLTVVDVAPEKNQMAIKGAIPGPRGGLLLIQKIGKDKNFVPVLKEEKNEN